MTVLVPPVTQESGEVSRAMSDARAIGRRVRYWRQRRNLGRKQFADMVERSVSWIDKIENGERNLLRLPMLERVAAALAIDPTVLTDAQVASSAAQCADGVEVQSIKQALGRYPMLSADYGHGRAVTNAQVERQLSYAGQAWLSSHFAVVAGVLPSLIEAAQRLVAESEEDVRRQAHRALVMAYRLACSMLLKYDSTEIGWLAADRALYTAQSSQDEIALARATRSVARAMSHTGQLDAAVTVSIDMAERLRPRLNDDDRDAMPLFGMLLLSAEIAAAKRDDAGLAEALHEDASTKAERLGPAHRGHHTIFGPANVGAHRVAALVRLRQGDAAVRYAQRLDPAMVNAMPVERRANLLLDLTDAHTQIGRYDAAIRALIQADRLAPEEVRCRPLARRLIVGLLSTRPGGRHDGLRHVAQLAGVAA